MKVIKSVIGALAILIGLVWILQGIDVIPGASTSSQTQLALAGILALVGGIVILVDTWRKKEA